MKNNKELNIKENKLDNKSLDIISKFGRGIISLEECYELLENDSNNVKDLTEILNEKLEKEYKDFCNEMKTKSQEEIIKRAYEITVKEELKEEIKNMNLHDKEKAIMIDQDDLLTEFYHDWLDTDVALGEVLKDTLEDSIASVTRYYGKQNNFRIKNR